MPIKSLGNKVLKCKQENVGNVQIIIYPVKKFKINQQPVSEVYEVTIR